MKVLAAKELSNQVKGEVLKKSKIFEEKFGRKICLAVVLIGNNPASCTYVNSKKKTCDELGIDHIDINYESTINEEKLLKEIKNLNDNKLVDGILVQMPLPKHIDENKVIQAISPEKDVDGFHPQNIGKLLLGQESFIACTPKGILRILDHFEIDTKGKNVCILGRSNIVGKPMAALLMQKDRNATVTLCHSMTEDLTSYTKKADIIIVAVGKINALTKDMVKENAVVIDVGINRVPDASKKTGYRLLGDVDYHNLTDVVSAMTPVPGGVGPMTIAMLMENTLIAACKKEGVDYREL